MPVEYIASNLHRIIPDPSTGYELAPITGKGLWSIVSPAGVVTNLSTLGIEVLAYTGAGMPPIENITTPFGILGGSVYQRTVVRSRQIILVCAVQGQALGQIQRIKQAIINQVAPYNSVQAARQLKLRYQLVNYCGDAVGTTLEVPVIFDGDLTGSTTNLYQDRFSLVFTELAPPGIVELATIQPSLAYFTSLGSPVGYQYRTAAGVWVSVVPTPAAVTSLYYDASGELWIGLFGVGAKVFTRSSSVSQAVTYPATPGNVNVLAIAQDAAGKIYVGGEFTTPFNFIMVYNPATLTWSAVGATLNEYVYAMAFDNGGNLYVSGRFTAPANYVAKYNLATSTWVTLGAGGLVGGGQLAYQIVKGLDGNMYFVGDFVSANGVVVNNIFKYDVVTGVTSSLAGGTNGAVYTIDVLPDGRLVIGGAFTTAGGVACSKIAIWNGTGFAPLGPGLNNNVSRILVDKTTGDVYIQGLFTALVGAPYPITPNAVKYNGSLFLPFDYSTTNGVQTAAFRASDKEIAFGTSTAFPVTVGGQTALSYAGTADVFPQVKLTGPGQVYTITNYTTGKGLYFNNLLLQAGETATLTIGGIGGVSFISSFWGNILSRILPGSDITSFGLRPGTNNITCFMTGGTGASKIELIYQNTHYSFEAGA